GTDGLNQSAFGHETILLSNYARLIHSLISQFSVRNEASPPRPVWWDAAASRLFLHILPCLPGTAAWHGEETAAPLRAPDPAVDRAHGLAQSCLPNKRPCPACSSQPCRLCGRKWP